MSVMASQITGILIVCSAVCSGAHHRKHQSFAPLAFVRTIHLWLLDCPHKGPVTWKKFPFDDVIIFFFNQVKVWLYFLPGRFLNQYRLIVKEIPETLMVISSKQFRLKTHFKMSPQKGQGSITLLTLIYLSRQLNPDEKIKLLVDMNYALFS